MFTKLCSANQDIVHYFCILDEIQTMCHALSMIPHLSLIILIQSALFSIFCFWRPLLRLRRTTGKIAVVVKNTQSAHDLIGRWLLLLILLSFANILLFAFLPNLYAKIPAWHELETTGLQILALVLLNLGMIFCAVAQWQMGTSWRIGIEHDFKTAMIEIGLYKYSRNPIYAAMIVAMLGYILLLPNLVSFFILCVGFVLIPLQVRLEEEYLLRQHGPHFVSYASRVRRWI